MNEITDENEKKIIQRIFNNSSQSIELIFNLYDHKYKEENDKVEEIINNLNKDTLRKKSFLDSL